MTYRMTNQPTPIKINKIKRSKDKSKNVKISKKKSSFQEFIEAIGVALIAAIILRIFLVQAFRIPTGSMKDTLMIGDMLLVNKFIYGVRTPNRIPFTDIEIPYIRLPGFKEPERGNIIVFKYPRDESLDYIKRCIALPGQTIEVRNGWAYVNGIPEGKWKRIIRRKPDPDPRDRRLFDYYELKTDWGDKYVVRQLSDYKTPWDDFGPIRVPKKGTVIHFPLKNQDEWRLYEELIENREHHTFARRRDGTVLIDGQVRDSYTIEQNYLFMMGDNRDDSSDSRDWGFMPRENVVGEALLIYFSFDKNSPLYNLLSIIRWGRIGMIIR